MLIKFQNFGLLDVFIFENGFDFEYNEGNKLFVLVCKFE